MVKRCLPLDQGEQHGNCEKGRTGQESHRSRAIGKSCITCQKSGSEDRSDRGFNQEGCCTGEEGSCASEESRCTGKESCCTGEEGYRTSEESCCTSEESCCTGKESCRTGEESCCTGKESCRASEEGGCKKSRFQGKHVCRGTHRCCTRGTNQAHATGCVAVPYRQKALSKTANRTLGMGPTPCQVFGTMAYR